MNGPTFVVMQRNSGGVVSLASGQLATEGEARLVIADKARTHPTLEFQIVQLTPISGWLKERNLP